jgi:hypothetical protein
VFKLNFFISRARFLLFAFCWGAMGSTGALVVPLLFQMINAKSLAGSIAAQLFVVASQLSLTCALIQVLCVLWVHPRQTQAWAWARRLQAPGMKWGLMSLLASGCMLGLVIPHIQSAQNREMWHALGSALYGLMWLLSGALLVEDAKRCFKAKDA